MRKLFSLFTALTLTAGLWATNSVITFTSTSKLFFGTDYFENAEEQVLDYKYIYDEISKTGTITFNGELVTIWGNLTTSSGCFEGCSLLTSITLPEGLTKIGDVAFLGCSSLASVTLPESLTTIGQLTFHGCSIKSITIPKNVKEIGFNAFMDCSGLTDFYVAWTTTLPTLQGPVFEDTPINTATLQFLLARWHSIKMLTNGKTLVVSSNMYLKKSKTLLLQPLMRKLPKPTTTM